MSQRSSKQGFTLIELMFAMMFLAVLLLAITTTILYVGKIYGHSILLKSVNQSGRDIGDSLRRDFAAASIDRIKYEPRTPSTKLDRLCVGSYTYVWNNPANIFEEGEKEPGSPRGNGASYVNTVREDGVDKHVFIGLARYRDEQQLACTNTDVDPTVSMADSAELFATSKYTLGLHKFSMKPIIQDAASKQGLYQLELVLGTKDQDAINTSDDTCKMNRQGEEQVVGADYDYCAVNRLELVLRAGGGF